MGKSKMEIKNRFRIRGSRASKKLRNNTPWIFKEHPAFNEIDTSAVIREDIYLLDGKECKISGETSMSGSTRTKTKHILVKNVVIDGIYIEHLWVKFSQKDWHKLAYKARTKEDRIYFTGEVFKYTSGEQKMGILRTKMGIKNAKLVTRG